MENTNDRRKGADMTSDRVAAERRAMLKSHAAESRNVIEADAARQAVTLRDAVRGPLGPVMTVAEALEAIREG